LGAGADAIVLAVVSGAIVLVLDAVVVSVHASTRLLYLQRNCLSWNSRPPLPSQESLQQ